MGTRRSHPGVLMPRLFTTDGAVAPLRLPDDGGDPITIVAPSVLASTIVETIEVVSNFDDLIEIIEVVDTVAEQEVADVLDEVSVEDVTTVEDTTDVIDDCSC